MARELEIVGLCGPHPRGLKKLDYTALYHSIVGCGVYQSPGWSRLYQSGLLTQDGPPQMPWSYCCLLGSLMFCPYFFIFSCRSSFFQLGCVGLLGFPWWKRRVPTSRGDLTWVDLHWVDSSIANARFVSVGFLVLFVLLLSLGVFRCSTLFFCCGFFVF